MFLLVILILFFLCHNLAADTPCSWSYANVNQWSQLSCTQVCGGSTQSPVNIKSYYNDPTLGPLKLTGYADNAMFTLLNTGHSIQLQAPAGYEGFFIDGVDFKQFHFHAISEEIFDGVYAPLTMHMVHVDGNGGYTVLAFLWEITPSDNPWLDPLISGLEEIPLAGNNITISMVGFKPIFDDLQAQDLDGYVNFMGSLTTPPCTEGVNWFVALQTLSISDSQWEKILELSHFNYRPIQRELFSVPAYDPKDIYLFCCARWSRTRRSRKRTWSPIR